MTTQIEQCYCFRCPQPLETVRSRKIGLGPDCEANVKLAFDKDIERGLPMSGDALFNLLALFGADEACAPAKMLALELISLSPEKKITWEVILGCFALARSLRTHGDEAAVTTIFTALSQVVPAATAMALGEASANEALLSFDETTNTVHLAATTVRKASEVLVKLASAKRHGVRAWEFNVRDAAAVLEVVQLRWPLVRISENYAAALEIQKNLPPIPPAPPRFDIGGIVEFVTLSYEKMRFDDPDNQALSNLFRNELGAAWNKPAYDTTGRPTWYVPTALVDVARSRVEAIFAAREAREEAAKQAAAERRRQGRARRTA